MYLVIVHVKGDQLPTYEFLEDSRADARSRAEEVAQFGFWIDDAIPRRFIPASQITLVRIRMHDDGDADRPREADEDVDLSDPSSW